MSERDEVLCCHGRPIACAECVADERAESEEWDRRHGPITEDWLKSVGFKWHQFDRQPSKHWLLWLGDAMNGGGFSSFEDIGIELAAGAWNHKRDDHDDWFCWLRGDTCHRYHRFIHVRHLNSRMDVIRMVEGLTGQGWNPMNHLYGAVRTPQQAERIRQEEQRRRDLLDNWRQRPTWAEVEKDDTRGRALPEHMEVAEKARGDHESGRVD